MKSFMEILLEKDCFCKTDSTERLYPYNIIENAFEEYKESVPAETVVSLPSGFIEDFITHRFHLKKGERVECNKDKLKEILNDFVFAMQASQTNGNFKRQRYK